MTHESVYYRQKYRHHIFFSKSRTNIHPEFTVRKPFMSIKNLFFKLNISLLQPTFIDVNLSQAETKHGGTKRAVSIIYNLSNNHSLHTLDLAQVNPKNAQKEPPSRPTLCPHHRPPPQPKEARPPDPPRPLPNPQPHHLPPTWCPPHPCHLLEVARQRMLHSE